ncbi:MAG: DUF6443 domain-containing protein [Ferruginibacter sp.]
MNAVNNRRFNAYTSPGLVHLFYSLSGLYKTLLLFFFLLAQLQLYAQQTPPAAYGAIPVSYVRTWDATAPETNPNTLSGRLLKDVKQATQYVDGLGRPLQTVAKQASLITGGTPTDMVSPVVYDQFGLEKYKYLPFVANNTGTNTSITDGGFKTNPFQQQATFYADPNGVIKNQGETYYYSQTNFEASPMRRPQESFAPGNSWVGTQAQALETNRRSVKAKYWTNTATDAVRIWNVTDNATIGNWGTYSSPGAYNAGELYKNVTADEHNKQVIEFKDKEGRVILKKVQLTATADAGTGSAHTGWLCTYYLYDNLNNLRCVIQPKGVELISTGWLLNDATILAEQCFRYEYDQRNRMIVKKVPGAAEVYMVYDNLDRLVLTQDGNLRTGTVKWLLTKYDGLNRPTETGLVTNSTAFATHLSTAYTSTNYVPAGTYEMLSKTAYDVYTGLPAGLSSTYLSTWNTHFSATDNMNWPYPQMPTQNTAVKGMVTWVQAKVLGTASQYISSVNIYDDKGRVIQIQTVNISGAVDVVTTQYSWNGKPLVTVQKQELAGSNAQTSVVVTKYTYDDLERLVQTEKKLSNTLVNANAMSAYKVIAKNEYDALGRVKKKILAPAYNSNAGLETQNYDYNIRGWMLGVNRDYAKDAASNNYFGFDLGYDKTTNGLINNQAYTAAQYNGNITGTVWKSKGDGEKRKYDFTYDAANRITAGNFTQYNGSAFASHSLVDFTVSNLSYDANGNILTMNQKGMKVGSAPLIDQLSYTYYTNTNKLAKVADAIAGADNGKLGDFKDGTNGTLNDYGYDKNGNLVTDQNKAIGTSVGLDLTTGGAITYNHLNLPAVITVSGKGSITYTYDAAGNKLKKVTAESPSAANGNKTITTTTQYIAGLVYESKTWVPANTPNNDYTNKLQFIPQEEGRIRVLYNNSATPNTPTGIDYDYMLKDHLGNVRMVLTEEVKQNYYPASTLEGTFDASTNSMINWEKGFYKIDNTKVVAETSIPSWGTETLANTKLYYNHNDIPPASPNPNYPPGVSPVQTAGSTKLYKLNATTNKTGLEFMIKVMAGDKIDILGKSYYLNTTTVSNANSTALDLLSLVTNMLGSPVNPAAAKGITAAQMQTLNTGLIPNTFFTGNNGETGTTVPKAYINYIFFDEKFQYAGGNVSRVGTSGTVKNHWNVDASLQNINVTKNGYLFVYVSNESNFDVFFDNLQVVHTAGPIMEETHYYLFGLTMAGVSSKAAGKLDNNYKYNGKELQNKEFSDGSGLEFYDFGARYYDPQLGVWHNPDPLAEKYPSISPWVYTFNNPLLFVDPDGRDNTVYLYAADESVSRRQLKKIAKQATANFAAMGLKTQVKVFKGKFDKVSYGKLDKTDAVAVIGNPNAVRKSISSYNAKFEKELGSSFGSIKTDQGTNPEQSQNPRGSKVQSDGNIIAIATGATSALAKETNSTFEEGAAFLVNHGAGHNANMNHDGDKNAYDEKGNYNDQTWVPLGPNVMSEGNSLKGKNLQTFINSPVNRQPTKNGYISIQQMYIHRFGNNTPNAALPTEQ